MWSHNDANTSWLRLTATSNCFLHPYSWSFLRTGDWAVLTTSFWIESIFWELVTWTTSWGFGRTGCPAWGVQTTDCLAGGFRTTDSPAGCANTSGCPAWGIGSTGCPAGGVRRFPVDSRLPSRRCQCQDSRQIYIWLRMEGMVFIGGEHSSQVESTKLWWQLPHHWLCLHRYLPPSTISLHRLFDCCDVFCIVVVVFHVIIVVVWGQCTGSAHHLLNHNRLCPHQPPAAKSLFAFANIIVVLVS